LINLTNEQYNKWITYSKVIISQTNFKCDIDYYSTELLHDLILRFEKLKTPKENLKNNYVFISLKNLWYNKISVLNKEKDKKVITDFSDINIDDEIYDHSKDKSNSEKLDTILSTYETLNSFDKKLYYLHFTAGLSQRKIARELGVNHNLINIKINNIKDIIKENYKQSKK